jgi:hypothetical protein
MAWQQRGLRRYYTRTKRLPCDKFQRQYVGTAGSALTAALAAADAGRRYLRLLRREHERVMFMRQVDREREVEQRVSEAYRLASCVAGLLLETAGFRQHRRGEWRKRRMEQQVVELGDSFREKLPRGVPKKITEQWCLDIRERARKGDAEALGVTKWLLEKLPRPSIAYFGGDPGVMVEQALILRLMQADEPTRLALRRKCALMREELAGSSPTAAEQLVAESITLAWLQEQASAIWAACATALGDLKQAKLHDRVRDRANRRFLMGLKTLALLRRLALPVLMAQVNTAVQVNVGCTAPKSCARRATTESPPASSRRRR